MMGGVAMKKYTIALLVCFLSFFTFSGVKKAETTLTFPKSGTINITPGETSSFGTNPYKISNCSGGENGYATVTPNSTGYTVKVSAVGTPSINSTDTVVCSYTTTGTMGAPETGTAKFKITIAAAVDKVVNLGLTATDYQSSKNIATEVLPDGAVITGYEVNDRGAEYINVGSCSGTTCNVSISDEASNLASDGASVSSSIKITYTLPGSDNEYAVNVRLAINTVSGARAYHGGAGVCNFSSDWKYRTWTDSAGKTYKFYQSRSSSATLPDCDSSNSKIPIEFKGWKESNTNDHVYAIGECSGALPAGSTAADGKNYSSCYERAPYVQIAAATGNVDMSTGWQTLKGNSGYYYSSTSSTTVALPELIFTGIHKNDELDYWYKSDDPSVHKNSGDSVDLDGSIWIPVVKTVVSEGWKDLYKTVNTNQTVALVVSGMTGCSASSEYVNINFVNGECLVSGVKETPEDVYADVQVSANGENVTYKFNVVKVDDANIIIDDTIKQNQGTNSEITNKQSVYYSENCTTFTITGGNSFTPYTTDGMTGTIYQVTEACGQSGNQGYYAFCLDPGRRAPSGTVYNRTKDAEGNDGFRKVVNGYLVEEGDMSALDELANPKRIAFHIAIRAVGIKTGATAATSASDRVLASHYAWYERVANNLDNISSYAGTLNLVSGVEDKLITYVNYYNGTEDVEYEEFERTVESTETVTPYGSGGAGYQMIYKGTLIAPTGVSVNELDGTPCSTGHGVTCTATLSKNDELTLSEGKNVYDYVVTISADNAANVVPPETDEDKKNTSFEIKYDGRLASADYAIVEPASGESVQRMFVFNTEQSKVYMYFSIVPTTCELPALDYKTHCASGDCDAGFNGELFMASGCCRLVTDEVKYENVIKSYCSGDPCTVSTMSSVCSLNSKNLGSAELYEIKEGAKYVDGNYVDQIGTCIVNVTNEYSLENKDNFMKTDSAQNTLNVAAYSSNRYCQVSCGEDWKMSLESFGNFVGENAVGAGSYFATTNSDIYISGSRTCYTSYINYDTYMKDLVKQSEIAVQAYNKYSEASHVWTDINEQNKTNNKNITSEAVMVCMESYPYSTFEDDNDISYTYSKGDVDSEPKYTIKYKYDCPNLTNPNKTCTGTRTENACKTWGYFYKIELNDKDLVENGKYTSYESILKQSGTANNEKGNPNTQYSFTENFSCNYSGPSEGSKDARLSGCGFTGYKDGDYSGGSSSSVCGSGVSKENGFCKTANDSAAEKEAFDEMLPIVQDYASEIMDEQSSIAAGAVNTIHSYSQQMYNCQHFELYNTTDDNREAVAFDGTTSEYGQNKVQTGTYLDHSNVSYVKIDTQFNPHVSYEYDEPEFMTILGRDNILVEYIEKNNQLWKEKNGNGDYVTSTNAVANVTMNAYESRNNTIPATQREVNLYRNYIETNYYNTSGKFSGNDVETYGGDSGSTSPTPERKDLVFCITGTSTGSYSPSLTGDEWNGGSCYHLPIEYVKAHYIKSSISNSSFYRNKGFWYLNSNDLKEHGDNLEEALNNANKRSSNTYNVSQEIASKRWSPFGNDQRELVGGNGANVFPVSLNTPRNLYLYSYEFGDIGSYMDGKIGRLMGDETSLIQLNTRTCFYEVYEELCLCCGSTITSYVENTGTVEDYVGSHNEINYTPSKSDVMFDNDNGVISFATSSVNLGDLNSDSDRALGNNWGKSQFLYSGKLHETTKGAQLLKAIESEGENAYAENPEYSYYLTPSTISAIRDYNDQYGYEVNYNNLKVYGSYAIKPICDNINSDSCWEFDMVNNNTYYITFQHYGSTFLEDFMSKQGAVYGGTLTEKSIDTSCYVTLDDASDYDTIKSKVDSGCRWVDYVENVNGDYYRLAFK